MDGELTIWDCFPSWWLMFIRSQVGDGKHKGPPYLKEPGWIVKFSLTVGVDIVNDIKRLFLEFQSAVVSFHQTLKRELGGKNFIVKDRDGKFLRLPAPQAKARLAQSRIGRSPSAGADLDGAENDGATRLCQEPTFVAVLCEPTAALPLSDSPNIRNLAKGCFARRSKMTAPCRMAMSRAPRKLPRLVHVVAAERQQAFATQAIDFRQIESDAGLVDRGNRTVEQREAFRRPAGREQHLPAKPR